MIDLIIAGAVGFICGSFLTVAVMALCMIAKGDKDDLKNGQ